MRIKIFPAQRLDTQRGNLHLQVQRAISRFGRQWILTIPSVKAKGACVCEYTRTNTRRLIEHCVD